MLVLSRHKDESVILGTDTLASLMDTDPEKLRAILSGRIRICVVSVRGDKARLGIDAHPDIPVHREEVQEAIDREAATA